MPWQALDTPSNSALNISPDMFVLRTIQPGGGQQVYFQLGKKFFKTRRLSGHSWNKVEQADTALADFIGTHWSALRDDLVKPFRLKQTIDEPSENIMSVKSQTHQASLDSIQDFTYAYVMFYRNICVMPEFNRKDLDANWAEHNTTYIFNQTLKLTKMHQIMDSVFLDK